MIRKIKVTDYPRLIEIWESAVLSTHDFLKEEDFLYYKEQLPVYFQYVILFGFEQEGILIGFMRIAEGNLEMLFITNIRTYTMGVLAVAQMGRCMGEVAYKVSDSTFLWCNALLRRLLCATVIRHCTVHTGRKPDGNHSKRTDNGGLLAKQLLLRRLLDGGKYRGTEMPKPRAGLGSMDDT